MTLQLTLSVKSQESFLVPVLVCSSHLLIKCALNAPRALDQPIERARVSVRDDGARERCQQSSTSRARSSDPDPLHGYVVLIFIYLKCLYCIHEKTHAWMKQKTFSECSFPKTFLNVKSKLYTIFSIMNIFLMHLNAFKIQIIVTTSWKVHAFHAKQIFFYYPV